MSQILGRLNPDHKQVTIVGGGVSGLLAAYTLSQKGYEIHLVEAKNRWGGLIQTWDLPLGKAESAAHSLLVTPEVRSLFEKLDIPLTPLNPASKARYILRKGRLRRFPLTVIETLDLLARVLLKKAPQDASYAQWSVAQWAEHHLGKGALRYLFTPMLQGIYGAQPQEICLQTAFPSLKIPPGRSLFTFFLSKLFTRIFSSSKHAPSPQARIMTPRHGMESLTQALLSALQSDPRHQISSGQKLSQLPQVKNLILATPADEAALLLKDQSPELSLALSRIEYSPLISATLFIRKNQLKRLPQGLGVLIPASENFECLGILFNSSSFDHKIKEPQDWISCTAFLGGSTHPERLTESDEELLFRIEKDLKALFGLTGSLSQYKISRWKRAIPKYNQDLAAAWEVAKRTWCSQEGHILFGNYTGSVSLRGMIEACKKL